MEAEIRYYKKRLFRFILSPMKLLKVKPNRIMLHNDMAQNYSGNPRYICDYLVENFDDEVEILFSVKDTAKYSGFKNNRIKFVKFNSFKYFIGIMTSKIFITNSGGYSYVPLRKNQIVINTHHGGGAYKKIGRYVYEDTPIFRKDLKLTADQTTIFLSSCKKFTKVVSDSLLIPENKFWEIGMPRNDILVHMNDDMIQAVRKKIGLANNQHLVLYAPTYRKQDDNYFKDYVSIAYGIDPDKVCEALSKKFGGEWIFGYRMHPCVVNNNAIEGHNVLNLTNYEEMQELLLAADVMINDFSSSMWDFILTGKPSFMFAIDAQHYIETTKLETPVNEWPLPKSTTNEELVDSILNFDLKKYREDCEKHYQALGGCETGHATELVCKYIKENINI